MRHLTTATTLILFTTAFAATAVADVQADLKILRERRLQELAKPAKAEEVADLLAKAKPDGSFSDVDYASTLVNDGWGPRMHLDRMTTLVGAYLAPGESKGDAKIKAVVLKALDWWLAHDYQSKNWFWNQIGVPGRLTPTLLAFWDDVPASQKTVALKILGRAKVEGTGANLGWLSLVVIDRGLINGNAADVSRAYNAIANDIKVIAKQNDGWQPDYSYNFHGPLLYSWGYGIGDLRDRAHVAATVADTGFALSKAKVQLVRDWALDGAQWFVRGPGVDFGTFGRTLARKGVDAKPIARIGQDLLKIDAGRTDEINAMIARAGGDFSTPLVGNKQFWRADIMTHHRPGYYASARMFSARTKNTEWGNGEALQSFYVCDGANVLMRDGTEYFDIYGVWDWQRIPGTTVELLPNFGPIPGQPDGDPHGFTPSRNGIVRATKATFVGGASDGQYGVSGGTLTNGKLAVNKAWVFFDDVYVCLGSGLTCDSGNPVITTLDQCYLRGPVTVADAKGPTTYDKATGGAQRAGEHGVTAATWLLHDGVGYVFPTPAMVRFNNAPVTGNWHDVSLAYDKTPETRDIFKAWIEHGPNAKDATYVYAVYPNTDAAALAKAAAEPAVHVAVNTADAQAVWHDRLKRGGALLYAAGKIEMRPGLIVAADKPCALLVAETADGVAVAVANPENKEAAVKVTVTRDGKSSSTTVALPGGPMAGKSVTKTLAF